MIFQLKGQSKLRAMIWLKIKCKDWKVIFVLKYNDLF